jgi:hypothetical protein
MADPAPRRRRFQFRLRTLMIAVALLAALCAYVAHRAIHSKLDQRLIIACYQVDVSQVVDLLRQGAKVNARFGGEPDDDTSPLNDQWSGAYGDVSWTPLMALASAPEFPDPPANAKRLWEDRDRMYKLQAAISKDKIKKRRDDEVTILRILVSHNADINADNYFGDTALALAVEYDKPLLVSELLEFGANPNTKTRAAIDGPVQETPLHRARSTEIYELLLKHGADPTSKDSWGNVPRP